MLAFNQFLLRFPGFGLVFVGFDPGLLRGFIGRFLGGLVVGFGRRLGGQRSPWSGRNGDDEGEQQRLQQHARMLPVESAECKSKQGSTTQNGHDNLLLHMQQKVVMGILCNVRVYIRGNS